MTLAELSPLPLGGTSVCGPGAQPAGSYGGACVSRFVLCLLGSWLDLALCLVLPVANDAFSGNSVFQGGQ